MAQHIPEDKIQEILDAVSIVDIVGEHVALKPQGSRMVGLCPFHNEKTPSFSVTPDKGLFYCFGCHKGGSAATFLMEIEGLSFPEAMEKLAHQSGISLPQGDNRPKSEEEKYQEALLELYKRLKGTFRHFLYQDSRGKGAKEYLQRRGIDAQTAERYQLGYVPEDRRWLFHFLKKRSYSREFLARSGLFSRRYPEVSLFSGRLLFPIQDHRGRTVGFGGRLLKGDGPKYINSPETVLFHKNRILYGLSESLSQIRKNKELILTEGYFDVVSLYQGGIPGAVAPLGTSFTTEQARLIKRYVQRVILWLDSDSAGIDAAFKAARLLETQGIESRVIHQEQGKDAAEILEKEGPGALQKKKKYPINTFDYLLQEAVRQQGSRTPEQKEGVIRRIFSYVEAVDSPVRQDAYLQKLAEELYIDPEAVRRGFQKRDTVAAVETNKNKGNTPPDGSSSTDRLLMVAVWSNIDYFEYVRSRLNVSDLEDPQAREIFILLEEAFRRENLKPEVLIEQLDESEKDYILKRISTGEFDENGEKYIKDSVRSIQIRSLEKKRHKVEERIRRKEKESRGGIRRESSDIGEGIQSDGEAWDQKDKDEVRELLLEKMYLDGELKKIKVNSHG